MAFADLVPEEYRDAGLSAGELDAAQEQIGVLFPPDLCELLRESLLTGPRFPDWRNHPVESFTAFRDQVIDGITFDAIHNSFWLTSWAEQPSNPAHVREIVAQRVRQAPPLVPIYDHRAIAAEPGEAGNPVFSIVQTDIIIYGADLAEYLRHEFGPRTRGVFPTSLGRPIRFWSDLLDAD